MRPPQRELSGAESYRVTMNHGESLVFPVELAMPKELIVDGCRWYSRPEFHVTTFTPSDLADALGVDERVLLVVGESRRPELTRCRTIAFDGRVARLEGGDGGRTLVAFCDVEGLDAVYSLLDADVRQSLERPTTHVTLYSRSPVCPASV